VLYGVMGLPSGLTAIMADKAGNRHRGVRVGESVGPFKLVALTPQNLTLEWDGQNIERKVDDLMDRVPQPPPGAPAAQNPANAAPANTGPPGAAKPGKEVGQGIRSCDNLDKSPAGTAADGWRKVVETTPFGDACRWVPQ
jgi:hypothetical protein